MARSQARSKKSPGGSKYRDFRKKKQFELGSNPTLTKKGATKVVKQRIMGSNRKNRLLACEVANVFDKKIKKAFKAKIRNIVDNPANRHFVRRSILTKGAIIETEKGKAIVTSRPGQEGVVNARLLE